MSDPAVAPVAPAETKPPRLEYIDNLRVLLTLLVVAHHAAQAYGPTGGEWPVKEVPVSRLLGLMITVNSMFFMGLFFFVSGFFTAGALARRGARAVLADRAWRFGVPCLLVLALTAVWRDRPEFLHLWFVADLFLFNAVHAAVAGRTGGPAAGAAASAPAWRHVAVLIAVLAVASAAVRIAYPVDAWVRLLGVVPLEPAHAVQYAGLYALGAWAARAGWLPRISDRLGRGALLAAGLAVGAYALYLFFPGRTSAWFAGGGLRWQNPAYAALEAWICVTLGLGLLWVFRRHAARQGPWARAFAADAYGIYCVHLPIVVAVHLLLAPLPPAPLAKFAVTTLAATAAAWALTHWGLRAGAWGRKIF